MADRSVTEPCHFSWDPRIHYPPSIPHAVGGRFRRFPGRSFLYGLSGLGFLCGRFFYAVGFLALPALATFLRGAGLEGDFRAAVFFMAFLALVFFAVDFFTPSVSWHCRPWLLSCAVLAWKEISGPQFSLWPFWPWFSLRSIFLRRRFPGTAGLGYFLARCCRPRRRVGRRSRRRAPGLTRRLPSHNTPSSNLSRDLASTFPMEFIRDHFLFERSNFNVHHLTKKAKYLWRRRIGRHRAQFMLGSVISNQGRRLVFVGFETPANGLLIVVGTLAKIA